MSNDDQTVEETGKTLGLILGITAVSLVTLEVVQTVRGHASISKTLWQAQKAYPPLRMLYGLTAGMILGHIGWENDFE